MITNLSPNDISAWGLNPRKRIEPKGLQPLIDSMRAVGWFGAIMVRPVAEAGRYEVLAGERRWRAACAVGLAGIACEVREMDDKAAIELAVVENRDRLDLDVIEEAGGYQAMLDLGWTVKEIASRSGRSEDSIYQLIDLLGLDEGVRDALRDGMISRNVARVLGRIEDVDDRVECLGRIVKPRMQDTPLSEKQAVPLIQREYLEPQKRQKAWEKKRKSLLKEHGKDVEIKSVSEAGEITGWNSGYERCDARPASYDLAVHARELDEEQIPTWGDLADKHGAKRVVVPDADGEPVFYVEKEPLMTAERVLGERDPEACIFALTGQGRHGQSVAAARQDEDEMARWKAEGDEAVELQKKLVKELYEGLCDQLITKRWDRAVAHERVGGMMKVAIAAGYFEGIEVILELMGIDAEALGDGDAEAGGHAWCGRLLDERGIEGAACLAVAWAVANVFPTGQALPLLREMDGAGGNDPALATRGLESASENHAGDGQPSGLPAAHGSASSL